MNEWILGPQKEIFNEWCFAREWETFPEIVMKMFFAQIRRLSAKERRSPMGTHFCGTQRG
jgi:hypothetical protein